jgi:acylphosphatase
MKAVNVSIFGKVQGVYFRQSTKVKAKSLGVKGYVLNRTDGSVFLHAEGDDMDVDALVSWCHLGPIDAFVSELKIEVCTIEDFADFTVR